MPIAGWDGPGSASRKYQSCRSALSRCRTLVTKRRASLHGVEQQDCPQEALTLVSTKLLVKLISPETANIKNIFHQKTLLYTTVVRDRNNVEN